MKWFYKLKSIYRYLITIAVTLFSALIFFSPNTNKEYTLFQFIMKTALFIAPIIFIIYIIKARKKDIIDKSHIKNLKQISSISQENKIENLEFTSLTMRYDNKYGSKEEIYNFKDIIFLEVDTIKKQINDCMYLISSTVKLDVFFTRLKLLYKNIERATEIEVAYPDMFNKPINNISTLLIENSTSLIDSFIIRYLDNVNLKYSTYKTVNGKNNYIDKCLLELANYSDEFLKESYDKLVLKLRIIKENKNGK